MHLDCMVEEGKGKIKESRYTILSANIHISLFSFSSTIRTDVFTKPGFAHPEAHCKLLFTSNRICPVTVKCII